MHTLADIEIAEEAQYRYRTQITITPIQHIRFLLDGVLREMAADVMKGCIQRPIPLEELPQEQTFVHTKYVQLSKECRYLGPDEWDQVATFTRGLLLGARMWRLAKFHRDEFAVKQFQDLSNIMLESFGLTLPQVDPEEEDVLELDASDTEDMNQAEKDPDASTQPIPIGDVNLNLVDTAQEQTEAMDTGEKHQEQERADLPDLRDVLNGLRLGKKTKKLRGKCYKCRERGHLAAECPNPLKVLDRAGSRPEAGLNP